MHLTQVAFLAILIAALTAAFSRGGVPERLGGALLLGAAIITPLVQTHMFLGVEVGVAMVDTLLLVALLWLSLTTSRHWPGFATAFQAAGVLTHLARFKAGPVAGDAYGHLLVLWSYPVTLSLLWGSLVETRRAGLAEDGKPVASTPAGATKEPIQEGQIRQRVSNPDDLLLLSRLLTFHDVGPKSTEVASELIRRTGSFAAAISTSPAQLRSWGVDERVAEAFSFARSTTRSMLRRKLDSRHSLTNREEALDYLHSEMAYLTKEQFRVLYLNSRHRLVCDDVHSEGSISETPVYPREVVKRAIEVGAAHLILAHNHPSGDPTPSRADVVLTRAIIDAARPLGITVIDHFVVGTTGHSSLKSIGLI